MSRGRCRARRTRRSGRTGRNPPRAAGSPRRCGTRGRRGSGEQENRRTGATSPPSPLSREERGCLARWAVALVRNIARSPARPLARSPARKHPPKVQPTFPTTVGGAYAICGCHIPLVADRARRGPPGGAGAGWGLGGRKADQSPGRQEDAKRYSSMCVKSLFQACPTITMEQ